ncbi:ABC transporter permease [Reyranella sp.]|uniref:ABC transporter permease n=1 Tax=Reyranella sp. TaxID=1929291 RepID=UPI002F921816
MGRLSRALIWIGKSLAVLVAIVVLNFCLIRLAPGDPATVLAGEAGASDPHVLAEIRQQYGLDRPLPEQLAIYLRAVVSLDLGFSYRNQRPVADMILERLPATLLLTGSAFLFALAIGIALGSAAARRVGRWVDSAISVAGLVFYAMPIFWIGLLFVLLFSVALGWLPPFGMRSMIPPEGAAARSLDVAAHLVLPALTLGLFYVAVYARLTRSSMLEVQHYDYIRTARAKGLPEGRIVRAHILRNALLPVITIAGIQAGQLVGGAIVVETVFAWPGIGRLAFDGLLQRDYNLLLGIFVICSVMVIFFNMLTDIALSIADPRIGAS